MLRVGLTGGIGCGKSVVADMFREFGVTVIDADQIAHRLVEPGSPILDAVVKQFGQQYLNSSGELDRQKLARQVFAHPEQKKILESLIHPAVRQTIRQQMENCSQDAYVVVAIPLLLETGFTDLVDRVLVVDCDEALQIQRVRRRDGRDTEQIQNIRQHQLSRTERLRQADDILNNDTDLDGLRQRVGELHKSYMGLMAVKP